MPIPPLPIQVHISFIKTSFIFSGQDASKDVELWATDGTAGNTRLIKNISASGSSGPDNFFVFNNTLYFTANDGVHGRELWQSDGTSNNTTLVADIDGAATSSIDNTVNFFPNGSNILFVATNKNVKGVYKLTSTGVSLIKNDFTGRINLGTLITTAAIGNKTIFTVDTTKQIGYLEGGFHLTDSTALQIWSTDGTSSGTQLLHTFITNSPAGGLLGFITPYLKTWYILGMQILQLRLCGQQTAHLPILFCLKALNVDKMIAHCMV